jgi:hypothetical protein
MKVIQTVVIAFPFLICSLEGISPLDNKQQEWDAKSAVQFLLKQQREDGSWPGTTSGGKDSSKPYSVAVSALVCTALLEYIDVDPKEIRPALDKGIKSCLEKGKTAKGHFCDEYVHIYPLRLVSRLLKHPEWKDKADYLKQEGEAALKRTCEFQGSTGGWGYSKGGKYTCFGTGDALIALHEAKQAGFDVDENVISKGVKFLQDMRLDGRGFIYIPGENYKKQYNEMPEKEACERSVARIMGCEWSLFLWGKSTEKELEASMEIFMKYKSYQWELRSYTGEPKKPQSWLLTETSSPYFAFIFYGYHNTALALRDIKSDKRKEWASALKADLIKAREGDGYWKHRLPQYKGPDTTLGGDSFATANVILALKQLEAVSK